VLQVCGKYVRLHMLRSSVIDHIIRRIMVETPTQQQLHPARRANKQWQIIFQGA